MQPSNTPGSGLTYSRRLAERVYVQTLVGLILGLVIIAGALVARYVVGVTELNATALVLCGSATLVYYTLAWLAIRTHREPSITEEAQRHARHIKYVTIFLDYIVLTVAIWYVGGARSPFLPFYLLHAILSCLLLSRRAAIFFHTIAYGFLAFLVLGEWWHLLPPPQMPAGAVAGAGPLDDGRYVVTVLVVYGVLFAATAYLLLGLAEMLRSGERRLRAANAELERLSLMRRDFLRIALHNLQSPVGVVTMFLGNLKAGLGGEITEQQATWIERSLKRLRGVEGFMHDLQMLSALESGRVEAQAAPIDVASLLEDLVAQNEDLARAKGQEITLDVPPDLPPVPGIELLVREAVVNYLTNAVKYTPDGGHIVVRARQAPPMVRIEVEDDGVGISEADRERLFSDFFRAKQTDAALGDVKGTGLGLTIVKRVAETHGGRTGVESEAGRGSTFYLELPT